MVVALRSVRANSETRRRFPAAKLKEQLQAITVAQDSMEAVGALVWQIATKKSLERCRQRRSSVMFQATPPLLGLRLAGVMRLPTQWR